MLGVSLGALAGASLLAILALVQWRQAARYLQREQLHEQALTALTHDDAPRAEILFAQALTLVDSLDSRERLLEARARSARPLWAIAGREHSRLLAFSANGTRLAVADESAATPAGSKKTLRLQDVGRSSERATLPVAETSLSGAGSTAPLPGAGTGQNEPIGGCAFSPNGHFLAVGGRHATVYVHDLQTAAIATMHGLRPTQARDQQGLVTCAAWSPNGQTLAWAGQDAMIYVRRPNDSHNPNSLNRTRVLAGHIQQITCLAWSADGNWLASGSWDGLVQLWDARRGRCVRVLRGHDDAVLSVAFSPDGKRLASGSWDTKVLLWDAKSGVGRQIRPEAAGAVRLHRRRDQRGVFA